MGLEVSLETVSVFCFDLPFIHHAYYYSWFLACYCRQNANPCKKMVSFVRYACVSMDQYVFL